MATNPTVIAASLDDQELRKSIDSLVQYVKDQTGAMSKAFDDNVQKMENAIKNLGSQKGSSSKSSNNKATEDITKLKTATQEATKATEDLGKAMQKVMSTSLSAEAQKQLQIIRESKQWQETGIYSQGAFANHPLYDPARLQGTKAHIKEIGDLEQQYLAAQKQITKEESLQIANTREEVALGNVVVTQAQQQVAKTAENLAFHERILRARREAESIRTQRANNPTDTDYLREQLASLLNVQTKEIQITNIQKASYNDLAKELKTLQAAYNKLGADLVKSEGKDIAQRIRMVTKAMQDMKREASRPANLSEALGHPEKTLDQINYKMQQLRAYLGGLDYKAQTNQVRAVEKELANLHKKQEEILGQNARLMQSNNALTRSWNYMKNRLAFYLTVGASTSFVKQLAEIRGQYEMTEKALGVLVDSAERGTRIFKELSDMALISPYTLIELSNAARQLTAYGVAAHDVVDMTRRLADVAAAVGAPIENIAYALGHVQSYGYLTSLQARQFANNGIPLVKELAKRYTELEGRIVSVSDVYDRMKKKQVEYADVMGVITTMTDKGGRFFDFQAKMADTLKVQLANLTLAWNNMLNEIGADTQGWISSGIKGLKKLFENWRSIGQVISRLIYVVGAYKAVQIAALTLSTIGRYVEKWIDLAVAIRKSSSAMAAFNTITKSNSLTFIISLVASAIAYFSTLGDTIKKTSDSVLMFGEDASKTLRTLNDYSKILTEAEKGSGLYKKTIQELNTVLDDYGLELLKETDSLDMVNRKREQAIELIKEEASVRTYANKLAAAEEEYSTGVEDLRKQLEEELSKAGAGPIANFFGVGMAENEELYKSVRENANVLSEIIVSTLVEGAAKLPDTAGPEYDRAFDTITDDIQKKLEERFPEIAQLPIVSSSLWREIFGGNVDVFGQLYQGFDELYLRYKRTTKSAEEYLDASKRGASATMSATEKLEANSRKLRQVAGDATALYDKIYDIVEIAQKDHTISFNLKLVAEQPPKWMSEMDLPELQRLAARFAALAESGVLVKGHEDDAEYAYKRALQYASAANKKQQALQKIQDNTTKTTRKQGEAEDEVANALKDELSLIKEMQSNYDKLRKAGVDSTTALTYASSGYEETLKRINAILRKYGIAEFKASDFVGRDAADPNALLRALQKQREDLLNSGKVKTSSLKALDVEIQKVNVTAKEYNMQMLTNSLTNQLTKIKDEYELALELDTDPELGNAFADSFGIDTQSLPKSFKDMLSRIQAAVGTALVGLGEKNGKQYSPFNVMQDNLENWAKTNEISADSPLYKAMESAQKHVRDTFKKNLVDTEKMLDDYVKKYGDYSDKVAEIESNRLDRIKKLNEAYYTDRMRQSSDYQAKLNAIEQGAAREKGQLKWQDFKESDLYIKMFENLQYTSTGVLQTIRQKLQDLRSEMGALNPEQVKQIAEQMEKIDSELIKRNPYKGLNKTVREGIKALKERKAVQQQYAKAESAYTEQRDNVAKLEQEIEAAKKEGNEEEILQKEQALALAKQILETLGKQRKESALLNEKNREALKNFAESFQSISNDATNFTNAAVSIRDTLADVGIDLGDNLNAAIDGIAQTSQGFSELASSVLSGNVFGAVAGGVKMLVGAGKTFAGLFGGNKKDYYTGMKEQVDRLNAILDKAVDYQLKKLGELSGPQAVKEYENLAKLNKMSEESYRDLARKGGRSGSSWGSHSYLVRANRSLRDDWTRLSEIIGRTITKTEDFYTLDAKSLQDIITYAPDVWDKLPYQIREPLEKVAEAGEKAVEYADKFREAITSISFSNLESGFESMLNSWTGDSKDLFDEFDKNAKQAIVRGIMTDYTSKALEKWLDNLTQMMSDGYMSDDEYRRAQQEYNNIVTNTTDMLRERAQAAGLNLNAEKELSALQQGIQGVTENTAGVLEAYMNGVSQQVYYQSDVLTQIRDCVIGFDLDMQNGIMSQMLLQMQQSYQVQMAIQNILVGWSNPSGQAVRVEMI